jgi:hypothetical protein
MCTQKSSPTDYLKLQPLDTCYEGLGDIYASANEAAPPQTQSPLVMGDAIAAYFPWVGPISPWYYTISQFHLNLCQPCNDKIHHQHHSLGTHSKSTINFHPIPQNNRGILFFSSFFSLTLVLMGDSDSRPASTQQTSVLSFFFPPT